MKWCVLYNVDVRSFSCVSAKSGIGFDERAKGDKAARQLCKCMDCVHDEIKIDLKRHSEVT